jgi:phage/plasmid-like protein (TIGR03299 family)
MSHELATKRDGRAAIAYRGETPWHGLGETIGPNDSLTDIQIKGGLDFDVVKTPVWYSVPMDSAYPNRKPGAGTGIASSKDKCVLYRSDTGNDLSVVSNKYQVVQPKQIIEFYRELVEKFGYKIETVGVLRGGRKVWALANTEAAFNLRENDKVKGFLLLATSYDGSMATQARFTSIRVVCANTLGFATNSGKADVSIAHSSKFNPESVKEQLQIGEAWARFQLQAEQMQRFDMSQQQITRFLLDVYMGFDTDEKIEASRADDKVVAQTTKMLERLTKALFESPGAQLASARGTLWGALNAVTFDVDHQLPSKSIDTRLDKAWFGAGNQLKNRALNKALELVQS